MKRLLATLMHSLGEVLDWLATDPTVKATMPQEMYSFSDPHQREE